MKYGLWLEQFPPLAETEPGTARLACQRLTHWATSAPQRASDIDCGSKHKEYGLL